MFSSLGSKLLGGGGAAKQPPKDEQPPLPPAYTATTKDDTAENKDMAKDDSTEIGDETAAGDLTHVDMEVDVVDAPDAGDGGVIPASIVELDDSMHDSSRSSTPPVVMRQLPVNGPNNQQPMYGPVRPPGSPVVGPQPMSPVSMRAREASGSPLSFTEREARRAFEQQEQLLGMTFLWLRIVNTDSDMIRFNRIINSRDIKLPGNFGTFPILTRTRMRSRWSMRARCSGRLTILWLCGRKP
jgi:hypothetical protein